MYYSFIPAAASQYAKAEFKTARQEANETPLQFHGRLRNLFSTAYPDRNVQNDSDLMNGFALGLIDAKAREKVMDAIADNPEFTYDLCLTNAQSKLAVNSVLGKADGGSTSGTMGSMQSSTSDKGQSNRLCYACKGD